MRIAPLAHHLHLAETLARWHHGQWSHLYADWSFQRCVDELRAHDDAERIPTTLIALSDDGELLGSASLIVDDLPERQDLSPWLASVFVAPEHRQRGIGDRLVAAAVAEARRLGAERLYLFTPEHERYYAARGWSTLTCTETAGHAVVVMSRATA
jgi:predicted N-acetyltransferase YhbS